MGAALATALACGGQVDDGSDGGVTQWGPTAIRSQAVDKMDVLFAIDDSASMGDKQDLLAAAIPTFFNRLLNPDCVDGSGDHQPGDDAACKTIPGTKPEFPPVHDLHVGIVSSSLGGGGSPDVCTAQTADRKGHLLNQPAVKNAQPVDGSGGNFLAWLPASDPKNAGASPPNVTPYSDGQSASFTTDFQALVGGVGENGCGLEAQLESWYRFLIQPDPYEAITLSSTNPPQAQLSGVDTTLLKMRHDFLRPDSLIAIIQITDEEDSWSDPQWLGGYGWTVRTNNFPGGPGQGVGPRGTSECDQPIDPNNPTTTGPNNPDCTSCAFPSSNKPLSGTPIGEDPNCNACAPGASTCPMKGWYSPATTSTPISAADGLNVRYGEQYMQRRYGLDPQFAIQRYVDGLKSNQVPDRDHETQDFRNYAPVKNCTNPLFAQDLPDGSDTSPGALCDLQLGPRTPDLVFYALIGGVPNSLLEKDLTSGDWQKILGKDPEHFDLTGIDPHMIESTTPRPGLPVSGATYNLGTDPDNGREWNTLTSVAFSDLQYACTFDLSTPKPCTGTGSAGACDCADVNGATTAADGPPLCDPQNRTTQIKGKAYPTIRELRVAQALGPQASVASICAKVTTGSTSDPSYGYNPAMNAILERFAGIASGNCFPTALAQNADGTVSCEVLVVYPTRSNQATGCTDPGMSQPTNGELQSFLTQWESSVGGPPPVLCVYEQLTPGIDYAGPSCDGSNSAGWCYVQGASNTGGCAQSFEFGGAGPPAGTQLDLICSQ